MPFARLGALTAAGFRAGSLGHGFVLMDLCLVSSARAGLGHTGGNSVGTSLSFHNPNSLCGASCLVPVLSSAKQIAFLSLQLHSFL